MSASNSHGKETQMRSKVTEHGVTIPKPDRVIAAGQANSKDPILDLGSAPICLDIDDASENHDSYLYEVVEPSIPQLGGRINLK